MRPPVAMVLLWITVVYAGPAFAGGVETGASETATLTARSSGPLPRDATIEVRTADENPDYAPLVPIVERGLVARGLVSAPGGSYILRFGYRLTAIPEAERHDPNFSIVGRAGTASRPRMRMQLRLRNQSRDDGDDILMTFELYQPGAPPLWHATVLVPDYGFERSDILARITEMALELLGESGVHQLPLE